MASGGLAPSEIVARLSLTGRAAFVRDLKTSEAAVSSFRGGVESVSGAGITGSKGVGVMSQAIGGLVTVAKFGAIALGVLGAAAITTASKLIGLARDAFETQQKFDKIFKGQTEGVQSYVNDTFAKFGIPKKTLEDAMSLFGVFGKTAGIATATLPQFSQDLVQAGLDLSSFYNVDPGKVFTALGSGLAGNIRAVRQFGIFISMAEVKQRAAQDGITGTLTDGQKVMIRQKLILEQLRDAHGDLGRTSSSLANQMRGFHGRVSQLGVSFGQLLLPTATALVHSFNDMLGPAIARVSSIAGRLGDTTLNTSVHLAWMSHVANFFADGIDAFVSGGGTGFLHWMDDVLGTGRGVTDFFHLSASILGSLWTILVHGIIPAFHDVNGLSQVLNIPLLITAGILGFLANNIWLVRIVLEPLITLWVLSKIATLAWAMAQLTVLIPAMIVTTAQSWLITGAELAYITTTGIAEIATLGLAGAMAILTSPVTLVILGILALILVGYLLVQNWDAVQAKTTEIWNVLWNNPFGRVLIFALAFASGVWAIWAAVEYGPDVVNGMVSGVQGGFHDIMTFMWMVADTGTSMWDGMTSGVKGAINVVLGALEDGINWAITGLNWIIDAANHLPFVNIPNVDYITIQKLHTGGRVTAPGLVNIQPNEEIISLPAGAEVAPLSRDQRPGAPDPRPVHVQVLLDRKVLAEAMVDGTADIEARR